jgi:Tfp pilus assembly protein PilX
MRGDRADRFARGERGMALFIALVCLVILSLAAAAFMSVGNVETKVAGHNVRGSQALNLAEAGVAEALSRLRRGDIPNNSNPRMVTQIFLAAPGSVPVLTGDSIALPTAQAAGQWLQYSTPNITDKVLTVEYKTDANKTVIYKYDATKNPAIQTTSGMPIFEITSTGRKGTDRRQVVTEVVQKPVTVNAMAALTADVGINFSGNSDVCGYNHSSSTPPGTKGRGPCVTFETGSGDKPGAWSSGNISTGGSSTQNGSPPTAPGQSGFYTGPWDVFDMSQSEYFTWMGTPIDTEPDPPVGIVYLDNNTTAQDKSGDFKYNGGDGEGYLYVDGDLTINGTFNYSGLMYIEGDLMINGTCWVLGGVIVKGKTTIKIANGSATILYSQDAIVENVTKYGGEFVTLSWIEN